MLLTPHLLTGAAIATKVHSPVFALILAFLSHYILDLPPQTEYSVEDIKEKRWRKSVLDFSKVFLDICLGALLIFFFSENTFLIYAAAFLAILPDGFTLLTIIFHKNKVLKIHWQFHRKLNALSENKKISPFWGIFSQVAVIAAAIFFLI